MRGTCRMRACVRACTGASTGAYTGVYGCECVYVGGEGCGGNLHSARHGPCILQALPLDLGGRLRAAPVGRACVAWAKHGGVPRDRPSREHGGLGRCVAAEVRARHLRQSSAAKAHAQCAHGERREVGSRGGRRKTGG